MNYNTRKIRNSFLLKSLLFWFFRFVFQWLPLVLLFSLDFSDFLCVLFHWNILIFDLRRNEFLIIFKNKNNQKQTPKPTMRKTLWKSKEKPKKQILQWKTTQSQSGGVSSQIPDWPCVALLGCFWHTRKILLSGIVLHFIAKLVFFWFSLDFHRVFSWLALVFLLFFRFFKFWFHCLLFFCAQGKSRIHFFVNQNQIFQWNNTQRKSEKSKEKQQNQRQPYNKLIPN